MRMKHISPTVIVVDPCLALTLLAFFLLRLPSGNEAAPRSAHPRAENLRPRTTTSSFISRRRTMTVSS